MAPSVEDIRKAQRAEGVATILGIGTANPLTCFYQKDFPEFYFRVTKSEHMSDLKDKFKRICDNTMIEKRHLVLSEDKLHENSSICAYMESSLDRRLDIAVPEVVRLGQEAALKAIKEWGQPKYMISHLIFCTVCNVDMPGADYQLTKLLGLRSSVKRFMLSQLGCYAGGTVLRLAKDIAENNKGSRVLVVCSETNAICFRGPTDTNHQDSMMVGHALFGDGSGAMIIGADPNLSLLERPIFEIVWTAQTILPESEGTLCGHLRETGLIFNISEKIPGLISKNIHMVLEEAFTPLGISDWNSIFWIAHPGGPAIFHQVEDMLGLEPEKLKASRAVLNKYGNM